MGNKFTWLLIAAFLAGLGARFLSGGSGTGEEPASGEPSAPAAQPGPAAEAALDIPVTPPAEGTEAPRRAEVSAVDPVAVAEADAPPKEEDARAHVIGQMLLPSGAPAIGAEIKLHGWGANSEREQKYGVPKDWEDVTGSSDVDGRFDLAFDPPRAFQFTMDASLAGHADLSWRWSELPPLSTTDVKTQTFALGCRVTGKVVDRDGNPTGEQWFIYADAAVGATGGGRDATSVMAPAKRATGAFELTGLPPGPLKLKAYSPKANWVDGPTVVASPSEVATAQIVYEGPDLSPSYSRDVVACARHRRPGKE